MEALEDVLIPVVAIISVFGSPILLAIVVARVMRHRSEKRSEQLNRLLDKFTTADEFVAFAETDAGADLMESITSGPRGGRTPVARSVHWGLIASSLGVGCIIVAAAYMYEFIVAGWLLLALGVGFLISAWVTYRYLGEDEPDRKPAVPETMHQ